MPNQQFTDRDMERVMADQEVTLLSGWTETNSAKPCDEAAYRQKLSKNHKGYMTKIQEALNSVTNAPATTE